MRSRAGVRGHRFGGCCSGEWYDGVPFVDFSASEKSEGVMVQIRGCERIHTWLVFPNLLHRLWFVSKITFLPIWEGLLNVHIHQTLRNGLCSARSIDGQTCPMLGSIGSRMLLLTCRKLRYLLKCQLIVTITECSPRCSMFPPRAAFSECA